jgi:hypothetical protein
MNEESISSPSEAESRNEDSIDLPIVPVVATASTSKAKIGDAPIKGKLPQPERKADVIGQSMLSIQEKILENTARIADVLEEFLILTKIEKGLLPDLKLTKDVKIVNVSNE